MTKEAKEGKRIYWGKGKGYLNAAGPQGRFILFLWLVLGAYTLLLKVFQKLAEIVQFPVFLPISLVTLVVFIGIVGTLYSHKFAGPLVRIRKALGQLAQGDTSVSLRLRESDDPVLKELVQTIGQLCEHSRTSNALIQETAKDLFADIMALREKIRQGAEKNAVQGLFDSIMKKQELLEKAVQSRGK